MRRRWGRRVQDAYVFVRMRQDTDKGKHESRLYIYIYFLFFDIPVFMASTTVQHRKKGGAQSRTTLATRIVRRRRSHKARTYDNTRVKQSRTICMGGRMPCRSRLRNSVPKKGGRKSQRVRISRESARAKLKRCVRLVGSGKRRKLKNVKKGGKVPSIDAR